MAYLGIGEANEGGYTDPRSSANDPPRGGTGRKVWSKEEGVEFGKSSPEGVPSLNKAADGDHLSKDRRINLRRCGLKWHTLIASASHGGSWT